MKDGYMVLKESGRYAIYTTEADARAALCLARGS